MSSFYILDTRSVVGNCALWWGKNRSGYVCDLSEAGRYTEAEALEIASVRGTDIPLPCSEVERCVVRHVRIEAARDLREKFAFEAAAAAKQGGAA